MGLAYEMRHLTSGDNISNPPSPTAMMMLVNKYLLWGEVGRRRLNLVSFVWIALLPTLIPAQCRVRDCISGLFPPCGELERPGVTVARPSAGLLFRLLWFPWGSEAGYWIVLSLLSESECV